MRDGRRGRGGRIGKLSDQDARVQQSLDRMAAMDETPLSIEETAVDFNHQSIRFRISPLRRQKSQAERTLSYDQALVGV